MSGKVLAVLIALIAGALLTVFLLYPYVFLYPGEVLENIMPKQTLPIPVNATVSSVKLDPELWINQPPEENFVFNGTHVIYTLKVGKYWDEVVLEDGTVVRKEFEKHIPYIVITKNGEVIYRERMPREMPLYLIYERVEIADLVKKRVLVMEEANTEVLGLKHYRRIVNETTFNYRWVSPCFYIRCGGVPDVTYLGNLTFKAYLSFVTYKELYRDEYDRPVYGCTAMEPSRAEKYLRYAELYSKLLKDVAGINLIFEPINETFVDCKNLLSTYRDITVNGVIVINVAEVPPSVTLNWERDGFYDRAGNSIALRYKNDYAVFVHELGHALALSDYYDMRIDEEPHRTIIYGSIMWNGNKITLGDLLNLLLIFHVLSREQIIAYRASDIGINLENGTILLPLTQDNRIPPPLDKLVRKGVLVIDWINPDNSEVNHVLLDVMRKIAELHREKLNS